MIITGKPWPYSRPPRRLLAIRLQAMGDLLITLPYLQQLRNSLPPGTRIDLLTREEVNEVPESLVLFDRVYSIGGGRHTKKQLLCAAALFPRLFLNRYEVLIDLQDNIISRLLRKTLLPRAWSQFDRFSPVAAGERTRSCIETIGLGDSFPCTRFRLKDEQAALRILAGNGWKKEDKLVVLNPAGAFETRNWEMSGYAAYARLWLERFPGTRFLIMGTDFIKAKAAYLQTQLGSHCMNLVNKTRPEQAFAIMQKVHFVLSEDSGLMHMAWVSGKPTLAIFGSTRSEKARPLGANTGYVDSSDLPCGGCMLEHCKYGDNRCLTRYSPAMIFERSLSLLNIQPSR